MAELPRVCVIGAGCSGLTVSKSLKDRGIPFDTYEAGSDIGGLWRFGNDNGMSNIYKSLHINTHRDRMEYRDYPMPLDYPDYPGHELIWKYFKEYETYFGLDRCIHYKTAVTRAERLEDGVWRVTLSSGKIRHYDALVVANGHHWSPRWPEPEYPGQDKFRGKQIHAHHYVDPFDPVDMHGKNVIVVGMGNSAMDIAVELSRKGLAKNVYLSGRRGAYVFPKYFFGKPFDKMTELLHPKIPFKLKQWGMGLVYRLAVGKMEDFGLPSPDHKLGEAHPTISNEILGRMGSGDIRYVPGIREFQGKTVRFVDGSEVQADVVVWCTGYNVQFPFFDSDFLAAEDNDLPLFHRLVKPGTANLFFVGLLQPLGAIMPLSEAQGKLIAEYLTGEYHLPDRAAQEKQIQRYERSMYKRYVSSARHTMQVDFEEYLYELEREARRGRKRAARAAHSLPIEPQAAAYPDERSAAGSPKDGAPKAAPGARASASQRMKGKAQGKGARSQTGQNRSRSSAQNHNRSRKHASVRS